MLNPEDIRKIAEWGDGCAQILLGFMAENGLLIAQDEATAQEWYTLAGKNGEALGLFLLARILARKEEEDKAESCLQKAAELGYPPAALALGMYYLKSGRKKEAFRFIASAVDWGYLPAFSKLARMYNEGIGVVLNVKKAEQILRQGAENGESFCADSLARLLLTEEASQDQIVEGLRWAEEAARKGNVMACVALSRIYGVGQYGVPVNTELSQTFGELARKFMTV